MKFLGENSVDLKAVASLINRSHIYTIEHLNKLPCVIIDKLTKQQAQFTVNKLRDMKVMATVVQIDDNGDIYAEDYKSQTEFEGACMDEIEWIVSLDKNRFRSETVAIMEEVLKSINESTPSCIANVITRVTKEFQIATDEEYELLKKQIFDS